MDAGYALTKGLGKVTGEFSLAFLVYNMKRVINIIGVKNLITAMTWYKFSAFFYVISKIHSINEKHTVCNLFNDAMSNNLPDVVVLTQSLETDVSGLQGLAYTNGAASSA